MTESAVIERPELPPQAGRVIAVANQKGGVGKTTTALNLATALALRGLNILLIDSDPQGNLTSGVGMKGQRALAGTTYEVLMSNADMPAEAFVLPTSIDRLWLLPADRNLTGAEIELVSEADRDRRLKRVVETLRPRYDYLFIDCPPSLGLLTLNALVAADTVLIPLHCEYFALEGLAELFGTLSRVQDGLNPALAIEGVLLTMCDDRTNLGQLVARDVRRHCKEKVFNTIIPRNVRLGEAPSHGLPGVVYDVKSRGALAYVALAKELVERRHTAAA